MNLALKGIGESFSKGCCDFLYGHTWKMEVSRSTAIKAVAAASFFIPIIGPPIAVAVLGCSFASDLFNIASVFNKTITRYKFPVQADPAHETVMNWVRSNPGYGKTYGAGLIQEVFITSYGIDLSLDRIEKIIAKSDRPIAEYKTRLAAAIRDYIAERPGYGIYYTSRAVADALYAQKGIVVTCSEVEKISPLPQIVQEQNADPVSQVEEEQVNVALPVNAVAVPDEQIKEEQGVVEREDGNRAKTDAPSNNSSRRSSLGSVDSDASQEGVGSKKLTKKERETKRTQKKVAQQQREFATRFHTLKEQLRMANINYNSAYNEWQSAQGIEKKSVWERVVIYLRAINDAEDGLLYLKRENFRLYNQLKKPV